MIYVIMLKLWIPLMSYYQVRPSKTNNKIPKTFYQRDPMCYLKKDLFATYLLMSEGWDSVNLITLIRILSDLNLKCVNLPGVILVYIYQ